MAQARRLLIVSNRLPFTARATDERLELVPSAGGLATGLRALHERGDSQWIGWPGDLSALPRRQHAPLAQQLRERRIVPVPLRRSESLAYYDGFCNSVLWPLLHYSIDRLPLSDAPWNVYRDVNQRFADVIAREYRPGDAIWIHDYHLLLVPGMLRARLPDADVGFFLHVPFPAVDVFRVLPWRREVLEGLLGASLIGFHTQKYAAHFRDAVRAMTALEVEDDEINANERMVRTGAFPMGIDVGSFARLASEPDTLAEVEKLRARSGRLIVGIDRLDYTKGIPSRLLAYERLLQQRPELRGRVQFVQIAVPSRGDTPSYQQFRRQVEELIGRINGTLGTLDWTPVRYLHQSLSPSQLVALYRAADVMLVTPLRDGMNLVAKEFIASRTDDDGVLVLSEFAGASVEIPEAISVNPYDDEEVAAAMVRGLTMERGERKRRMQAARQRVALRDADWWSRTFLRELEDTAKRKGEMRPLYTRYRAAGANASASVGAAAGAAAARAGQRPAAWLQ